MRTVFNALILTLVLNLPSLFAAVFPGYSALNSYSDVDEYFYLPQAINLASDKSSFSFYNPRTDKEQHDFSFPQRPNLLIAYSAGKIAVLMDLTPRELGLLLDILSPFFGFICVNLLFKIFSKANYDADLASAFVILCPWIFMPSLHFNIEAPFFPTLSSAAPSVHFNPPILRGIFTQVSYPIFALALYTAHYSISYGRGSFITLLASALLSGTLFYVYVFAWGVAITVTPLSLFLVGFFVEKKSFAHLMGRIVVFLAVHLTTIAPGMLLLMKNAAPLLKLPELGAYWFFSVPSFILLIALFLTAAKLRANKPLLAPVLVSIALISSEFFLMNLQPLTQSVFAAYHFSAIYIYPFFSGFVALFIVSALRSIQAKASTLRFTFFLLSALIVIETLHRVIFSAQSQPTYNSIEELTNFLRENVGQDQTVVVPSFSRPFTDEIPPLFSISYLPHLIYSETMVPILHQDWIIGLDPQFHSENLDREALSAFLYSGRKQLLWPCPMSPPSLPGDTFSLTWTVTLFSRYKSCLGYTVPDICDLLKKFKVDFIVGMQAVDFRPANEIAEFTKQVFSSTRNNLLVYEFDRTKALSFYCGTSPEIDPRQSARTSFTGPMPS